MRLSAIPVACLALATSALAQTVPPPDGAWRGSLGAGFTNTTGNTDAFNAALNADAVRHTEIDKATLQLLGLYGEREEDGVSELTASQLRARARYDRDLSELTYGFLGYDLEKDKLADLKWRNSPSLGAGLHLRSAPSFTFDVFAGYSYNHESLYDGTSRSFHEALLEALCESAQPLQPLAAGRAVEQVDRAQGSRRLADGDRVRVDVHRTGLAQEADHGGIGGDVAAVHAERLAEGADQDVAAGARVLLGAAAGPAATARGAERARPRDRAG